MPEVLEARKAYKQAEADALLLRARARAQLGRAVVDANQRGSSLEHIARQIGVATEQVRRYRDAFLNWDRDHRGVPLD